MARALKEPSCPPNISKRSIIFHNKPAANNYASRQNSCKKQKHRLKSKP